MSEKIPKSKISFKIDFIQVKDTFTEDMIPQDIKKIIEEKLLTIKKKGGRPSLLHIIKDRGMNPYIELLNMIKMRLEGLSYDKIADKYETSKSVVYGLFEKLKKLGILQRLEEIARHETGKVRVFYKVKDGKRIVYKSDIDYIQRFIETRSLRGKTHENQIKQYLRGIAIACKITKKLPHQWNEDDINKVLTTMYNYYKSDIEKKVKIAQEKIKSGKDIERIRWMRYTKLSEKQMDDIARHNVYNAVVTPLRQILKFIGRQDLIEKTLQCTMWKREVRKFDVEEEPYITVDEYEKIVNEINMKYEGFHAFWRKLALDLKITLKCRLKGSIRSGIWGLQWDKINWENGTIDVFESKTKGGIWWKNCIINLFFDDLQERLRYAYEHYRIKDSPYIFESMGVSLSQLESFYNREIPLILGRRVTSHDLRKTGAIWLVEADVPLEMIAGKPENSPFGVGWLDLNTLLKYYSAFTKKKILRERIKIEYYIKRKTPEQIAQEFNVSIDLVKALL